MKLFFVVYLAGKVIGSLGPVNDDLATCQKRIDSFIHSCEQRSKTKQCPRIEAQCEYRTIKPVVGSSSFKA